MGLPGLLCARLGASQVLLTDYEPVVVNRLADNAALNGLSDRCAARVLDWFALAALPAVQRQAYDLLLLGDVIYAAAVVGPLVDTIAALLRPRSGETWRGKGGGRGAWPAPALHASRGACRCCSFLSPLPSHQVPPPSPCIPICCRRRAGGASHPPPAGV